MHTDESGARHSRLMLGNTLLFCAAAAAGWVFWTALPEKPRENDAFRELLAADTNPVERIQAAEAVARGNDAVPQLTLALTHGDRRVRAVVALSLGSIGPGARSAAEPLFDRLDDEHPSVRCNALVALHRIGADAQRLAPRAVRLLEDGDRSVQETARDTLVRLGDGAIPIVCQAGEHGDPRVRVHVAVILQETQSDDPAAINAARRLAGDENETVRRSALRALIDMRVVTRDDLLCGLRDSSPAVVRLALSEWESAWTASSGEGLPELTDLLGHRDTVVRDLAAYRLGLAGAAARAAVPDLVELLPRQAGYYRVRVAEALAAVGAEQQHFAPTLLQMLYDAQDENSAWSAGLALATYAPELGREQVAHLVEKLGSEKANVRHAAAGALMGLGPCAVEAGPALIRLLNSSDPGIRLKAVYALGNIRGDVPAAVPALIAVLNEEEQAVHLVSDSPSVPGFGSRQRSRLSAAGRFLSPEAAELVRQLASPSTKEAAIESLGKLGRGHDEALAEVIAAAADPSPGTRVAVAAALAEMQCPPGRSAPLLKRMLRDFHTSVQLSAIRAIGRLRLTSCRPDLEAVAVAIDRDPHVRSAAAEMLEELRTLPEQVAAP
jgi:HEAT repeat protein